MGNKKPAPALLTRVYESSFRLHILPLAIVRRGEDGVADAGGFEGVAEGGAARFAAVEAGEEIGDLMDEGVLVADAEAGDPPLVHVRHIAVGDVHAAPTARVGVVAMVKKFESVEVVQIPTDGGICAVDFKRVKRLVAARVSGGFK